MAKLYRKHMLGAVFQQPVKIFLEVFDGIAFWQGFDETGALTPPSFFDDGELQLGAQASEMGWQLSGSHADGPDHFVLKDMQRSQETEIGRFDACLKSGLGHFQAHEVIGNQRAPDFLLDPCRLLAAQGECHDPAWTA